jgi:hypothetical protein
MDKDLAGVLHCASEARSKESDFSGMSGTQTGYRA